MIFALLLAVAVGGTPRGGDSDPEVWVLVEMADRDGWTSGDTVSVCVANRSPETIYLSPLCDVFVQAFIDSAWADIQIPDCSNLRVRPVVLEPEGNITHPVPIETIPAAAAAGRFRVRYQAMDDAGYRVAYSPAFKVKHP